MSESQAQALSQAAIELSSFARSFRRSRPAPKTSRNWIGGYWWAMSEENVELAYRAIELANSRDLDGLLALMAEDVRADPLLAGIEGGYQGRDGVRHWWQSLFDAIPDFTTEAVEVRDYGDELVLAVLRNRGHGAETGTPFESTTWLPMRLRQGQVFWWGNFSTEEEALDAAGLRE